MGIFKKSSGKSGAAKKSASAAKKSATPKKAPTTKKTAAPPKGVAAKPKAKPAPPAKAVAKEKTTSAPQTPSRAKAPAPGKPKRPGRAVVVKAGTPVATKLGTKWNCFKCGARFYDLNKPEPLCPKCGTDQRQRPKVVAPPPQQPAPKKQPRPMAPLLEDEDDGSVRYDEDIDLGVRTEGEEPDEELFQPGEFDEDDVFGGGGAEEE
jgi:uncharacterized protein FYDLN